MDTIEWGDPIEGVFDGANAFPSFLKHGDECMIQWLGDIGFTGPYPVPQIWAGEGSIFKLPISHPAYLAISRGFTPWSGGDEAPGDWDGSEVLGREGMTYGSPVSWTHPWQGGGIPDSYDIIGYRAKAQAKEAALCEIQRLGQEFEAPHTFRQGDYVVAGRDDIDVVEGDVYRMVDDHRFADADGEPRPASIFDIRPATPAEIAEYLAEQALEAQYKGEPLPGVKTVTLPVMTREECLTKADEKAWSSPNTSRMAYLNAYEDLGLIVEPARPATDIERFEDFHGGLDNNQRDIAELAIKWARENG